MFESKIRDFKATLRGIGVVHNVDVFDGAEKGSVAKTVKAVAKYGMSLSGLIEGAAARTPNAAALIDDDGELTYTQLRNQARLTAEALASHGIDQNSRVGIMARNGRGFIVPLASKGYLGYTVFLLNVGASGQQLRAIIDEHQLDAIIFDSEFDERLPEDLSDFGVITIHGHVAEGARADVDFQSLQDLWANPGPKNAEIPKRPKQGGVIMMSSGTTGIPKAVHHSEPVNPLGVLAPAVDVLEGARPGARIQLTASCFHLLGWGVTVLGLGFGTTLITQRIFDPENVLRQVDQYKCTGMVSSAVFLKDVLAVDDGSFDTSSLHFIMNAGNAMSEELVRGLQKNYGNILASAYGSTEGLLVAVASPQDLVEDPNTAGYPVWAGRMAILDEKTGEEVADGTVGVLHAHNSMSMKGYLGDRHEPTYRDGLLDFGDHAVIDPVSKRVRILGRNNDMIIVGGENIWPASVSDIIDTMDGVLESYCVGIDDPDTFQKVKAYVVLKDGIEIDPDQIRDWVAENFMLPAVPKEVVFYPERLPRNVIGKVVKRDLKDVPAS